MEEVEVDAVPSPSRLATAALPSAPSGSLGPNEEEHGDVGIPKPEPPKQENGIGSKCTVTVEPTTKPPTHQNQPKVHARTGNKKQGCSKAGSIYVSNSKGIFFGQVINNYNQPPNNEKKEEKTSECDENKPSMEFTYLRNSTKTVDQEDRIIVSECLDMKGLSELSQALGIEEVELNIIKENFGSEGVQEIAYQTLVLWSDKSTRGENQSAMLNILSDKLHLVYRNGGKKALKGLYKRHFPS